MTTRLGRATLSAALAAAVLSVAGAPVAIGAEADPSVEPAAAGIARTTVDNVKGKKLKVAKAAVAKNWTRFKDPVGDQFTRDGSPAPDAEPWTDLTTVSVVRAGAAIKMLRVLGEDYPLGTVGTYYGADADWKPGQDAFYVVAKTAAKLPRDGDPNVQLIVTFDGDVAVPHQAGSLLGPYDGAESFSLSGPFPGGAWASGTTNLEGWERTEAIPFYNGPSQDMGYYDRKNGTFMHVARVPGGATSATVTLRAADADGEVLDELRLPSGGRFLGLDSPTWGLDVRKGREPLACRSVETRSAGSAGAEDLDPGTSLIRYTVGWSKGSDVADKIVALGDMTTVGLVAVGSEEEPRSVDAAVTLDASTDTATFSVIVPDGQWLIGSAEDVFIKTPGGQSAIDLRPLTGSAGVLTGAGLDGFVAGDQECGS